MSEAEGAGEVEGETQGKAGAPEVPEASGGSEALREKLRGTRRGWIRLILFAFFTALIFYLLFRKIDAREVGRTLAQANPWILCFAGALTALFPVFSALRWRRVLGALGYRVSFRRCFDMIMAAWPVGTITPSKTGDFVKAYYLKDQVPVTLVLGSVLAERLMDVLVLLFLALLGCLSFRLWGLAALAGGGLLAGCLTVFLLLHLRLPVPARLQGKVEPMLRALRLLGRTPSLLGTVIVYTFLNWFTSIIQLVLCYLSLGVHVPVLFATGALPLAIFVGLLPLTLSGMGTRDSALIFLFGLHPVLAPDQVSLGVGILYSLFGYWVPALVGLPFLRRVLPR